MYLRLKRGQCLLSNFNKTLTQGTEVSPTVPRSQSQQPKEDLRGDEGISPGGMTIVRDDSEQLAEAVERELADALTVCKRPAALEMQRQVHRIEAAVHQFDAEVTLIRGVQRRNVMPDVVADDDAVLQIMQEAAQRVGFFEAAARLIARDAVDRHRRRVARDLEQRLERILEDDVAVLNGNSADRDEAVGDGIESRRLGVEHHEAHAIDGSVVAPRCVERALIIVDEPFSHSASSQS